MLTKIQHCNFLQKTLTYHNELKFTKNQQDTTDIWGEVMNRIYLFSVNGSICIGFNLPSQIVLSAPDNSYPLLQIQDSTAVSGLRRHTPLEQESDDWHCCSAVEQN